MEQFDLKDERHVVTLSDDMIEEIAEKAADKAIEKMENKLYMQVGKTFLDKLFKFIGILILGTALWLDSKGYLKAVIDK